MSWDFIDKTSQIAGILAFVPILYSAFALYRLTWKKKQDLKKIMRNPGAHPGILIIDAMTKGPIENQVKNYIWQLPEFKEKREREVEFATVEFGSTLTSDDMEKMTHKIRSAVGKLQNKGVTQFHVFISGPTLLAAMTGGILYNAGPACFYQYGTNGYQNWGPISR